jgi:hypothetical protein
MTDQLARHVPEDLAVNMTWAWERGQLEFRFPHTKDEQAYILRLSDWLEEDEENATILAEWMQQVETAFAADPLMRAIDEAFK